jgi:hypothetical protein
VGKNQAGVINMKKLIALILFVLGSSVQAETYFCSYTVPDTASLKTIITRAEADVFWWTSNAKDKYMMKLAYETGTGIFLIGNFSTVYAGATVIFINKNSKEISITYQQAENNQSSDVFYGDCIVE